MEEPEVSVLMAVYNGRPYLQEALKSILDQTLADFEFIIVNDGSTDGSKEVLDRCADRDDRIRLFHQENRGLIASLNRGLDMARGKYIARMDADDISHPERLQRQIDFLEANPEIGVLGTRVEFIASEGETVGTWNVPVDPDLIAWKLLFNTCLDHPTVVARQSLLNDLGGYVDWATHAEDYELWTRAAQVTRLANLRRILLKHRRHEDSITVKKRRDQIQMACRIAAKLHREILGDSADERLSRWLVWMKTKNAERAVEETGIRPTSGIKRYINKIYKGYTNKLLQSKPSMKVKRLYLASLVESKKYEEGNVKKGMYKIAEGAVNPEKSLGKTLEEQIKLWVSQSGYR